LTNPVKPDFLKTAIRDVDRYALTKYAVISPYIEDNVVNYSKKRQKTAIF